MRHLYTLISLTLFTCSFNFISTTRAQIPTTNLVGYYPFSGNANDQSTYLNHGTVSGAVLTTNRFGEPNKAYIFNGTSHYIEIPDADQLSIATTGELSISVWMRPDVLDFPASENEYVHWMGKGVNSQHEWVFRIYDLNSSRPNRTSCYVFNLSGGLGSGSYVEESLSTSAWIHFVAVYNYPDNTVKIYKNGVLRDTDFFTDYSVVPGNGTAPMRVGTRDFGSYFRGGIDDIRVYNRVLTAAEITALYNETSVVTSNISSTESNSFQNYPNPAHQNLYVSTPEYAITDRIEIYNSAGQIIYSKEVNGTMEAELIDVSAFHQGVYYIKIHTNSGTMVNKFIKE